MMSPRAALGISAAVLALGGCSTTTTAGTAAPAPGSLAVAATAAADRQVCVDLDAAGGQMYSTFVVPMMAGQAGSKSVDVSIAEMSRGVAAITQIGAGVLSDASPAIADEAERMVAAAEAFQVVDNFEGTALLTSFVGLSVACQQAGHKPSWFDGEALTR